MTAPVFSFEIEPFLALDLLNESFALVDRIVLLLWLMAPCEIPEVFFFWLFLEVSWCDSFFVCLLSTLAHNRVLFFYFLVPKAFCRLLVGRVLHVFFLCGERTRRVSKLFLRRALRGSRPGSFFHADRLVVYFIVTESEGFFLYFITASVPRATHSH